MKTKLFVGTTVFLCVFFLVFSCEKTEILTENNPITAELMVKSGSSSYKMTEHLVKPKFGKPNSTKYFFQVYDISGINALSVKLYELASSKTTYLSMSRNGNLWILSTRISNNGWYTYRYVYSKSKKDISGKTYDLCNTYNTFDARDVSHLTWPFGADGSSWTKRSVKINGKYQKWAGGSEPDGLGNGPGEGFHKGLEERFSDDWNRGTGSQDLGAELRSPLDGIVLAYGTYNASLGKSKYVTIMQKTMDGRQYKFFFGHMDKIDSEISKGKFVRAGITKLGTLGMTGASSPHAHCTFRDISEDEEISVPFIFDAKN